MSRYSVLVALQSATNYWSLDEPSAPFIDAIGGVSLSATGSPAPNQPAVVKTGVSFTGGSSQSLISASNSSMTFDQTLGYSFSFIMRCDSTMGASGAWGIISRRTNSSLNRTFGAFMQGSTGGTINIDFGNNQARWNSGFVPVQGNYYHVAVTYNPTGGIYSLYANGVLYSSTSGAGPLTQAADSPFYIGALGASPVTQLFPGLIDEVAVWNNKTLSPSEVLAQYNTAFPIIRVFNGDSWQDADRKIL